MFCYLLNMCETEGGFIKYLKSFEHQPFFKKEMKSFVFQMFIMGSSQSNRRAIGSASSSQICSDLFARLIKSSRKLTSKIIVSNFSQIIWQLFLINPLNLGHECLVIDRVRKANLPPFRVHPKYDLLPKDLECRLSPVSWKAMHREVVHAFILFRVFD